MGNLASGVVGSVEVALRKSCFRRLSAFRSLNLPYFALVVIHAWVFYNLMCSILMMVLFTHLASTLLLAGACHSLAASQLSIARIQSHYCSARKRHIHLSRQVKSIASQPASLFRQPSELPDALRQLLAAFEPWSSLAPAPSLRPSVP